MVHLGLSVLHSRYVENTWSNNYLHTLYFNWNKCILKWVLPGLSIPPGFGIQKGTSQKKSFERTQEQMNKRNWGFAWDGMVAQGYTASHGRARIMTHTPWPPVQYSRLCTIPGVLGSHHSHHSSKVSMRALTSNWGQGQPGPLQTEEMDIHHSPAGDIPWV